MASLAVVASVWGAIALPNHGYSQDQAPYSLEHLATYHSGVFDESAAEIAAYDANLHRVFFTNANSESVDVLDVSNPEAPTLISSLNSLGGSVNSLDVHGSMLAVAIQGAGVADTGSVAFFDTATLAEISRVDAGVLPDMLTFTPDGSKVVVANEGEPNSSYTVDPEGSVTVIDVSGGAAGLTEEHVTQIGFGAFNDKKETLRNRGVRIFGPNATVAQDLEPEYVAVTKDSLIAYVALQENNAFAVVDLEALEVLDILALGAKDYSRGLPSNIEMYALSDELLKSQTLGVTLDGETIPLGGLSGLFFEGVADNGNLKFVTHPDRGPDAGTGSIDGIATRIFKLPELQAAFFRFELNPESGEISITEKIALTQADGTSISGLPNVPGDDGNLQGQGLAGNLLPFDPFGADLEGVVVNPIDGSFWACDEYRPAIYHFSPEGVLIARFVPGGAIDAAGTKTLPAAYNSARDNRGFEAISLDTETGIVYAFIQTPLGYDGTDVYNGGVSGASSVIRVIGINPQDGSPVAEYVYLLDKPSFRSGNVDKIGDATFVGDGTFYVIERDSGTTANSAKYVFEINLAGATNLLAENAPALMEGKSLEQHSADDLASVGIRPVTKRKIVNLATLGYLPSDKPEGIAVLPDGSFAVLNDNDFEPDSKDTVLGIVSFTQSNSIDANDEDENYAPTNLPVLGLYLPDAIDVFETAEGETFIITANEGDAREYEDEPGLIEEAKLEDLIEAAMLDLNDDNIPDVATDSPVAELNVEAMMSELNVTSVDGDIDGDGLIEVLYTYGGRSFSIFDIYGNLVFDSGDMLESITFDALGSDFNANNDENQSGDSRSDNKGPEPEAVVVGTIGHTQVAFVGLERVGGVASFDVTNPYHPTLLGYDNHRDFSVEFEDPSPEVIEQVGDLGPESIVYVRASESPSGEPMAIVANEVSGSVSFFNVKGIAPLTKNPGIDLDVDGTFQTGVFDASAAEIVSYDPIRRRLFVTNSDNEGIDIIDVSNPMEPTLFQSVADLGGQPTSVDVRGSVAAVAVPNEDGVSNGEVVFLATTTGGVLNRVDVGVLPDMLTFSPDGSMVLTANEGEPNDEYTIDPEGSVSIISVGSGSTADIVALTNDDVTTVTFESLDAESLRAEGIRIFGPGATAAQDLEPEYVAVSPDSKTAYVSFQENNALGIIDLRTKTLVDVVSLGFKDHSVEGNGIDASNRDGGINIKTWPVLGMYQPDTIAVYEMFGQNFVVSVNEGDARDYDGFSEEIRVADLTLDPEAYPDAATLQLDENLGRLKTTNATGDIDGDGDVDQIYAYGARSFTIWNSAGELVWDSGDELEQMTARLIPENFNSNNDENDSFDSRSDDKGPEPEALTLAEVGGRVYAFIGLERVGGIAIYDITYPGSPFFVNYFNNRDFEVEVDGDDPASISAGGDFGPESIEFIPADVSPTGSNMLAVANEVSGSTSLFQLDLTPSSDFMLQTLHSSDNESAFQDPNTLEPKILNYAAIVSGLEAHATRRGIPTLHVTAGDHTLPGPFYQASAEVESLGFRGLADIAIFNEMGLDANGIGNHEFDGGINEFARLLAEADYPFLAVNLDFNGVELEEGVPAIQIGEDGASVEANAGKVARSSWIELDGHRIGLIGRAPADFFNVVEDPLTKLPGLDFVGGRNPENNQPLVSAVDLVLEQVALLESKGVNKIILLDHAQDFTGDPLSASSLRGIDIIVAAGSTGFMARPEVDGPFNLLREGDTAEADYPTVRSDSEGADVVVVNSDQLNSYVGRLVVGFDMFGRINHIDANSGPVATTQEAISALDARLENLELRVPAGVQGIYDEIQSTDLVRELFRQIGTTTSELVGARAEVRSRETNLGRLAADSTLWFARKYVSENGLNRPVDIALKNGGGIRSAILGPAILNLQIQAALAFNNRLGIVDLSAVELVATMENAVSRVPSLDGRFPQLAGAIVEFDSERPGLSDQIETAEPSRVKTLIVMREDGLEDVVVENFEIQGELSRTFTLATNSFLLTGGDGYQALRVAAERESISPEVGEQQILADYILDVLGGVVDLPEPLSDLRVFVVDPALVQDVRIEETDSGVAVSHTLPDDFVGSIRLDFSTDLLNWIPLTENEDYSRTVQGGGDSRLMVTYEAPIPDAGAFFIRIVVE